MTCPQVFWHIDKCQVVIFTLRRTTNFVDQTKRSCVHRAVRAQTRIKCLAVHNNVKVLNPIVTKQLLDICWTNWRTFGPHLTAGMQLVVQETRVVDRTFTRRAEFPAIVDTRELELGVLWCALFFKYKCTQDTHVGDSASAIFKCGFGVTSTREYNRATNLVTLGPRVCLRINANHTGRQWRHRWVATHVFENVRFMWRLLERQEWVRWQFIERRVSSHRHVNKFVTVKLVNLQVAHTRLNRGANGRKELRDLNLGCACLAFLVVGAATRCHDRGVFCIGGTQDFIHVRAKHRVRRNLDDQ